MGLNFFLFQASTGARTEVAGGEQDSWRWPCTKKEYSSAVAPQKPSDNQRDIGVIDVQKSGLLWMGAQDICLGLGLQLAAWIVQVRGSWRVTGV